MIPPPDALPPLFVYLTRRGPLRRRATSLTSAQAFLISSLHVPAFLLSFSSPRLAPFGRVDRHPGAAEIIDPRLLAGWPGSLYRDKNGVLAG